MGAEEQFYIDTPDIKAVDWRIYAVRQVVFLFLIAIFYWVGMALHIWQPAEGIDQVVYGLAISWIIVDFLLKRYRKMMSHLLFKTYYEGWKHANNAEYGKAFEAFEQCYDLYSRHPQREKLYRFLSLKTAKYTFCEFALISQARLYRSLVCYPDVLRCYRQCLILNPDNKTAITALNLAVVVAGGDVSSMHRDIPFRDYSKQRRLSQPRWKTNLLIALAVFLFICSAAMMMLVLEPKGVLPRNTSTTVNLVVLIIAASFLWCLRWIISQMLLTDFHRGEKLYRKERYCEGIHAFQNQADFLQENPWIDKWRWLLLPRSEPFSYREWALIRIADGYIQLGEGDGLHDLYKQIQDLNPSNGLAYWSGHFIHFARYHNTQIYQEGGEDMTSVPRFKSFDLLYTHLMALYGKGLYDKALEIAAEELKHYPDRINYLRYFQACMAGCLDRKDEAIRLLEAMEADDYWLSEEAWADADFDSLRDLPEFERIKAESIEKYRAVQAKARPELLTVLPDGYAKSESLPLLIALHGNFSSVRWHKDHWREVANEGWLVGLPQSTQVVGLDSEGAVAYVWNDYDWAQREVSDHHAALIRAYPVDPERIVLAGFSRGAEMAIQLALSGAIPVAGFIAVCPGGPNTTTPELWEPIIDQAKGRDLRGYVIMGEQDRFVPGTKRLVKLLGEAGIQHEFEVHPDMGHDYPPDFKNRLEQMLAYVLDRQA